MNAMRDAIMKRRMKLAGDVDFNERKDADLNPDEGSNDDLNIQNINSPQSDDGLAPDISAVSQDDDGEMMFEKSKEMPIPQMGDEDKIDSFFSPDDVGKPGIRGKAANLMAAAKAKFRK